MRNPSLSSVFYIVTGVLDYHLFFLYCNRSPRLAPGLHLVTGVTVERVGVSSNIDCEHSLEASAEARPVDHPASSQDAVKPGRGTNTHNLLRFPYNLLFKKYLYSFISNLNEYKKSGVSTEVMYYYFDSFSFLLLKTVLKACNMCIGFTQLKPVFINHLYRFHNLKRHFRGQTNRL